jgi:hypothetical protein
MLNGINATLVLASKAWKNPVASEGYRNIAPVNKELRY